jgi:hypothetical protein
VVEYWVWWLVLAVLASGAAVVLVIVADILWDVLVARRRRQWWEESARESGVLPDGVDPCRCRDLGGGRDHGSADGRGHEGGGRYRWTVPPYG